MRRLQFGCFWFSYLFCLPSLSYAQDKEFSNDLRSSIVQQSNGVLITQIAGRGRRRHESSGIAGLSANGNSADTNHYNYHFEYWKDRVYHLEVRDYVAQGGQRIVIQIDTIGVHASNSGNQFQNVPYVKCFKDYGSESNYFYSPAPQSVPGRTTQWVYEFREFMEDDDTNPGRNRESNPGTKRQFRRGDIMECEVTVRWQAIVDAGETAEANYYGQIFRYRVGIGGLVGFNRDPNNGKKIVSMNSMIGGFLTVPIIHTAESPRSYMQPSPNIQLYNLNNFLEGRRIFHTSFIDGSHFDPTNTSNGANSGHPDFALGLSEFEDRCSDCHIDNGNGEHLITATGFLTPRMVGLGLLEAIPEATLRDWADPDDSDGDGVSGVINATSDGAGRFGYKATHATLYAQIEAAARDEIGVSSNHFSFSHMDALVAYVSLLGVPSARSEDLLRHEGWDEFHQFGCDSCHKTVAVTGEHPFEELSQQYIRPFTDLLLHDLGEG